MWRGCSHVWFSVNIDPKCREPSRQGGINCRGGSKVRMYILYTRYYKPMGNPPHISSEQGVGL